MENVCSSCNLLPHWNRLFDVTLWGNEIENKVGWSEGSDERWVKPKEKWRKKSRTKEKWWKKEWKTQKNETKSRSVWPNVNKSPIFADIPHSLCQIMNIATDFYGREKRLVKNASSYLNIVPNWNRCQALHSRFFFPSKHAKDSEEHDIVKRRESFKKLKKGRKSHKHTANMVDKSVEKRTNRQKKIKRLTKMHRSQNWIAKMVSCFGWDVQKNYARTKQWPKMSELKNIL